MWRRWKGVKMNINNFQIMVGDERCNAGCKYCVSRLTYPMSKYDNYLAPNLIKVKKLANKLGIITAIITGKGEPTLVNSDRLRYVITDLNTEFPIIELKTNGINLTEKDLQNYYHAGLTTLAISRAHYDDKKNNEAMNLKQNQDMTRFTKSPICKRLTITMCRDYIDSPEEIAKTINYVKLIGFQQLTLYPVGQPNFCHNDKIKKWIDEHSLYQVQLYNIQCYLQEKGNLITEFGWGGKMYDIDGITVVFGYCLDNKKNIDSGNFHSLILGTDNHIRLSWEYEGSIVI